MSQPSKEWTFTNYWLSFSNIIMLIRILKVTETEAIGN